MKKRYFMIGILLIVVLVASTFYIVPKLINTQDGTNETAGTTKDEPATTDKTTTTGNTTSKTDTATNEPAATPTTSIVVPEEMQIIIDENADYLYEDTDEVLAPAYPTEMIPLYDVLGVSDSKAMTSDKGNPGWITSYVSEDSTEDLLAFYRPLLMTMADFSEENISASTKLKATVSGYAISLTVAPNDPQKTDLQGNGAVSIFIEQV